LATDGSRSGPHAASTCFAPFPCSVERVRSGAHVPVYAPLRCSSLLACGPAWQVQRNIPTCINEPVLETRRNGRREDQARCRDDGSIGRVGDAGGGASPAADRFARAYHRGAGGDAGDSTAGGGGSDGGRGSGGDPERREHRQK